MKRKGIDRNRWEEKWNRRKRKGTDRNKWEEKGIEGKGREQTGTDGKKKEQKE